jgi:hypothetical protein
MVAAAPRYQNRYQPGTLAARCFPLRAAPSYSVRSVWIYKIWLGCHFYDARRPTPVQAGSDAGPGKKKKTKRG